MPAGNGVAGRPRLALGQARAGYSGFRPNPGEAIWTPEPGRYLAASISMERPPGDVAAEDRETRRARLAAIQGALARRLSAEPGLRGWAFSDEPPGEETDERRVRVDGDGGPPDWGGLPGVATYVDPSFFAVLGVRPVAGRLLGPGDVPPDPTAILESAEALDEVGDDEATLWRWAPSAMVGLSMIAIVLSMAALYALMSFTVAHRTKEIGIRVALGGNAGRVVGTVARRALGQLALGVTLGAGFWTVLLTRTVGIGGAGSTDELAKSLAGWPLLLLATTGAVIAIGVVACLAPVLRGLRVPPVEALRAEG